MDYIDIYKDENDWRIKAVSLRLYNKETLQGCLLNTPFPKIACEPSQVQFFLANLMPAALSHRATLDVG